MGMTVPSTHPHSDVQLVPFDLRDTESDRCAGEARAR